MATKLKPCSRIDKPIIKNNFIKMRKINSELLPEGTCIESVDEKCFKYIKDCFHFYGIQCNSGKTLSFKDADKLLK